VRSTTRAHQTGAIRGKGGALGWVARLGPTDPGQRDDGRGVVHDGVDPAELLEGLERRAEEDGPPQAWRGHRRAQRRRGGADGLLLGHRADDAVELGVDVGPRPADLLQHPPRLLGPAMLGQPAAVKAADRPTHTSRKNKSVSARSREKANVHGDQAAVRTVGGSRAAGGAAPRRLRQADEAEELDERRQRAEAEHEPPAPRVVDVREQACAAAGPWSRSGAPSHTSLVVRHANVAERRPDGSKDTYDHSCFLARSNKYQHLMTLTSTPTVDDRRGELAADQGRGVRGDEPAADRARRGLRDVHRHRHRGQPDREPDDEPAGHLEPRAAEPCHSDAALCVSCVTLHTKYTY
jgi:hypothetical protein